MLRGSGGGNSVEQAVLDINRIESELRVALDDATIAKAEILAVIDDLPATEYGILCKRHLDPRDPWRMPSWLEIGNTVYLSERCVRHLYGQILDWLKTS